MTVSFFGDACMRDLPESECTDDNPSILHFGCQTTEMARENAKHCQKSSTNGGHRG